VTIVILGAALNSEIEHQTTVDSTTGAPRPLGERGAYVADTVGGRWPARGGDAAEKLPASEDVTPE
jgi:membrane protein